MIDFSALLRSSFWFSSQPGPMQPIALWILLAVFGLSVLASLITKLLSRQTTDTLTRRLYQKLTVYFASLAAIGLVIWFFIWQAIPYLSSRYWLVVWLLIAIIWKLKLAHFRFVVLPARRKELTSQRANAQYLPRRKK